MNDNNKLLVGLAVVLVLVVGIFAWYANSVGERDSKNLSSTLTYSASGGQIETYNLVSGVIDDLAMLRNLFASTSVASSSISWGTIGISPSSASSSVIDVSSGGTIGDLCLVETATAASSSASFRCEVTATGASHASATIYATAFTTSTVGPLTTRIWILPVGSFKAPAALTTVTTSTP